MTRCLATAPMLCGHGMTVRGYMLAETKRMEVTSPKLPSRSNT